MNKHGNDRTEALLSIKYFYSNIMNGVNYHGLPECGNLQKRYELVKTCCVICAALANVIMFYVDWNSSVHWSFIILSCSGIIANVWSDEDISHFVDREDIMLFSILYDRCLGKQNILSRHRYQRHLINHNDHNIQNIRKNSRTFTTNYSRLVFWNALPEFWELFQLDRFKWTLRSY